MQPTSKRAKRVWKVRKQDLKKVKLASADPKLKPNKPRKGSTST